jgi:hypothetical protein
VTAPGLPTPTAVALRLAELSRMLDTCQTDLVRLDEDAVRCRARYEVAHAKAFLESTGTVDERKQLALLAVADERLAAELADQQVRGCRTRLAVLRDQVEVGRSLGASVRAEWAVTGGGAP